MDLPFNVPLRIQGCICTHTRYTYLHAPTKIRADRPYCSISVFQVLGIYTKYLKEIDTKKKSIWFSNRNLLLKDFWEVLTYISILMLYSFLLLRPVQHQNENFIKLSYCI